jgi:hypothetical protein
VSNKAVSYFNSVSTHFSIPGTLLRSATKHTYEMLNVSKRLKRQQEYKSSYCLLKAELLITFVKTVLLKINLLKLDKLNRLNLKNKKKLQVMYL